MSGSFDVKSLSTTPQTMLHQASRSEVKKSLHCCTRTEIIHVRDTKWLEQVLLRIVAGLAMFQPWTVRLWPKRSGTRKSHTKKDKLYPMSNTTADAAKTHLVRLPAAAEEEPPWETSLLQLRQHLF